ITIDKRYCGPPNSGNGGYVCGRLAGQISGGAEVTLLTPPPLDKQLDVVATEGGLWELRDGATVVATGQPASLEFSQLEWGSFERTPILLGRMSARIEMRPRPGERCVITAWGTRRDGRKRVAEAAAYGETGTLLAVARTTWIAVDREVQLGRSGDAATGRPP